MYLKNLSTSVLIMYNTTSSEVHINHTVFDMSTKTGKKVGVIKNRQYHKLDD